VKDWKTEHCSQAPEEVQQISPDTYIERRNIREVTHEEGEGHGAYTEWMCESRIIGISEYNMLKSIKEIDTQAAIDAYTEQLIEEGVIE